MDNLLETLTKKQMLRRSVGFSAGYDLQGPLDNLLATLDNKADVAEVGGPERTKVVTMDIAGEGFDCLQVFDLARSLETSWTRLIWTMGCHFWYFEGILLHIYAIFCETCSRLSLRCWACSSSG